jgi:ER-bound oxygenase mpaB/B'/Rubber oxygenase, catalytic domain
VTRARQLWLGTTDRFARLRRIESLDLETKYREITGLFYADFRSVMLSQSFSGFMLTFAAPRMSRILGSTGELQQRIAKRVVDTALIARAVLEHGLGVGAGKEAARRVHAMHSQYDIHEDDFVVVGCDAALVSLELADKFGWRPVSDKEREALRLYYNRQARAFGSRKPLPPTIPLMRQCWSSYVDNELRFEPQNLELATVLIGYFSTLLPFPWGPLLPKLLLGILDPRITRACGIQVPSKPVRWIAHALMRRLGRRDPVPDDAPDGMEAMVRAVYPNGWQVDDLGTHIQARQAVPQTEAQL